MDPLEIVEEKYHMVVTAGYSVIVGIIVLVLRASALERLGLWVLAVIFFATVLSGIRKGLEPPKKFDV
jgi:hypothetical protein